MLVNSKELFKKAQEGHYAIPSANVLDMESIKYHVGVAQELGLPLIVGVAEAHLGDNLTLEDAALVGKKYADAASVPVVLHLDHGMSVETCKKAIDLGFTSVMIDASMKSFEENVAITKEVVEYAKAKDVSVEAEIGHVASNFDENDTDALYTTAEEAKKFCEESGCDSLAISIGTAHGVYKAKAIPEISFDRLAEIHAATDVPLVLHGGSGSGDDNLNRCAKEGISKVNIYTDLYLAAMASADESGAKDYLSLRAAIKAGIQNCLKHYYSVFETK
ncbi:fructose-bisphosphate aldolase [Anaerostipes sp. 992a]|uniref:class II fructose-bisphosphate aldolase n=1 Tax=Anaerostipes sp. 992a TaxID=1261637 RepID=UPI00095327A3|nr:class II fructose-bisphosphate aldolase [Anaerostipes sp. 992a]OLR63012.1 fructose-bisphosphate aldolase [Anaerostipes sp. 992a]